MARRARRYKKSSTLHVQRALTRMPTEMGGGYQEAEPKTDKSRRTIALPNFAVDALRKHREHQEEMKHKAGEFWQEHNYVFCTHIPQFGVKLCEALFYFCFSPGFL